jgi:general secretion pathway protein G
MNFRALCQRGSRRAVRAGAARIRHRAFTLIELMFVITLLGILAAMVVPRFRNVTEQAEDMSVHQHLTRLRHQIAYYRAKTNQWPDLIGNQWDDLVQNDYLQSEPKNPLNKSKVIAAAAGAGVGWVWRDNGWGVQNLYATGKDFLEITE